MYDFVISAGMMQCITNTAHKAHCTEAMIDSGANVNVGPITLAETLQLEMIPHTDKRGIGTAKSDGLLTIIGWIFPSGYTGPIAIVKEAAFTLLAVVNLQTNGMGVDFPHDEAICRLYTQHYTFVELTRNHEDGLYFINLKKLMNDYMPTFVTTKNDIELNAINVVLGGCCGQLNKPYNKIAAVEITTIPHSSRKKDITHDISYRVWRLHKRFNHTSLKTLAHMIKENTLGEVDVTYQEINLVDAHQDCYACAVSKWKMLTLTPKSGMRPTILGKSWSMDYKGPYATMARGGYTGKFVFVEWS